MWLFLKYDNFDAYAFLDGKEFHEEFVADNLLELQSSSTNYVANSTIFYSHLT
jgi:hypothetical protein